MMKTIDVYLKGWLGFGLVFFLCIFFLDFDRGQVKQIGLLTVSLPALIILLFNFRRYLKYIAVTEIILLLAFFFLLAIADYVNAGAFKWQINRHYLITLTFIFAAGLFAGMYERYIKYLPIILCVAVLHIFATIKMCFVDGGNGCIYDPLADVYRLFGLGVFNTPSASAFIFSAIIIFGAQYLVKNASYRPRSIFIAAGVLVCFYFVIGTGMRTAVLGLALAAFVICSTLKNSRVILLSGVVLATFLVVYVLFSENMYRRGSFRPELLSIGIDYVLQSPFSGYGYVENAYKLNNGLEFRHTHNEFVRIAEIGGIPALLVFLALVYKLFVGTLSNINRLNWLQLAAFSCVVFSLVTMCFTANKIIGKYTEAYIYFWMPIAFLMQANISRRMEAADIKRSIG